MLSKVHAAALQGVDALTVEVEVHVGPGEERVVMVGLPDAAVRESIDRVSTALTSSGYRLPANPIQTLWRQNRLQRPHAVA